MAPMRLRTALSIANLVAIGVAFLVLFALPEYSTYAFYALFGWIFVGFGLMYLPGVRRPTLSAPDSPRSAALPSGTAPPTALDFCVWCGTSLPPGSPACPACGRRVAPV